MNQADAVAEQFGQLIIALALLVLEQYYKFAYLQGESHHHILVLPKYIAFLLFVLPAPPH